jgi:hypothetical protein
MILVPKKKKVYLLACLETVAANSLYRGPSTHHDMSAPRDEPVQIQTWVAGGPRRAASQPTGANAHLTPPANQQTLPSSKSNWETETPPACSSSRLPPCLTSSSPPPATDLWPAAAASSALIVGRAIKERTGTCGPAAAAATDRHFPFLTPSPPSYPRRRPAPAPVMPSAIEPIPSSSRAPARRLHGSMYIFV